MWRRWRWAAFVLAPTSHTSTRRPLEPRTKHLALVLSCHSLFPGWAAALFSLHRRVAQYYPPPPRTLADLEENLAPGKLIHAVEIFCATTRSLIVDGKVKRPVSVAGSNCARLPCQCAPPLSSDATWEQPWRQVVARVTLDSVRIFFISGETSKSRPGTSLGKTRLHWKPLARTRSR